MESEDASDEEASHCNPPKMDLTNNQHVADDCNRRLSQKRFHHGSHQKVQCGILHNTYDTIPTRNGRELSEIWVSKVGTNF